MPFPSGNLEPGIRGLALVFTTTPIRIIAIGVLSLIHLVLEKKYC